MIVYKERHCNGKISCSSRPFAPHVSPLCAPHFEKRWSKGRETPSENQLVLQVGGWATGQSPVPRKQRWFLKLQLFRIQSALVKPWLWTELQPNTSRGHWVKANGKPSIRQSHWQQKETITKLGCWNERTLYRTGKAEVRDQYRCEILGLGLAVPSLQMTARWFTLEKRKNTKGVWPNGSKRRSLHHCHLFCHHGNLFSTQRHALSNMGVPW